MKKLLFFFLILFYSVSLSQSYPHISELRGLEDSLGNTHLFYRYVFPNTQCWDKSIYHYDLQNNMDTLFIPDFGYQVIPEWGCEGVNVFDYEFFDNDYTKFIYGGYDMWIDPIAIIIRYDGEIQIPSFGGISNIEISQQNDSLVYASLGSGLYKSVDGGYNFTINMDSLALIDNSLISLSSNNDLQIYGIEENKLVRSENDGFSYIIVDNSLWVNNSELFYDMDGEHIYGVSGSYSYQLQSYFTYIYVSGDNGNPFTWNNILEYQGKVWFTHDENISGEIYYSAGNRIFKSTDFGNTFSLYKELDRKVTGLYKKSGTNILYASTPLKIYEITPDTIQIIKNIPVPESAFKYYPLKTGNRWVYDKYTYIEWNIYHDIYIREVIRDTTLENGKKYFQIGEYEYGSTYINYSFERIDSSNGMVYKYDNTLGLPESEFVIDDLLASVGDTIQSFRMSYPWEDGYTIFKEENTFNKWGLSKPKKVFEVYTLHPPIYSVTQDIGLDSIFYYFDFGQAYIYLKGCIVNDELYGDTTVVSVEDEKPNTPAEFSLSQNYPNPFNPSTSIQCALSSRQFVTLKVYDVLGNEITTLVNEEKPAGEYEVEFNASNLTSGIYFYQFKAGEFIQTKKMVLMR